MLMWQCEPWKPNRSIDWSENLVWPEFDEKFYLIKIFSIKEIFLTWLVDGIKEKYLKYFWNQWTFYVIKFSSEIV